MIFVDDYHPDNYKVADLLDEHHLQAIFAIELLEPEAEIQIKELSDRGFIIASHTVTHAHLSRVNDVCARLELEKSKERLEELTGKQVDWIVYPRGRYNDKVIKMAKELGYKYGRTTKLFNIDEMQQAGVHLSYPREEYKGVDPFDIAKDSPLKDYWFHTKEVIKFDLWAKLKKFFKEQNEIAHTRARAR